MNFIFDNNIFVTRGPNERPDSKKELTVEEKIEAINKTAEFGDIKLNCFPKCSLDNYYFVSYSHKDYKKVFEDIFHLQENGVSIWYDKELRVGRDWEIEVKNRISDFNCKGVIFYLSDNSINSKAVNKEIDFVKKSGKSYVAIRMSEDLEIPKNNLLKEMFNDNITYISYNNLTEYKSAKIKEMQGEQLFNYFIEKGEWDEECLCINSINNINIVNITVNDFININLDRNVESIVIENFCFANCKKLGCLFL